MIEQHLLVQIVPLEPFCLVRFSGVCQAGLQTLIYIAQSLHLQAFKHFQIQLQTTLEQLQPFTGIVSRAYMS